MEQPLIALGLSAAPLLAGLIFRRSLTRALLDDLRLLRIVHYVILAGLGYALFLREPTRRAQLANPQLWLTAAVFIVALAYAAVFAIVTNNLEDIFIDRITNPTRPLIKGTVVHASYLRAGIVCLATALIISALTSLPMLVGIVAVSVGYFIYSCRPFRLKRIPLVAKLMLGLNSLCVAIAGFVLAGGRWNDFPLPWALYLLVPLSLAANFVDLKDTPGDKAGGVVTLPVWLGDRKARFVISGATLFAYLTAGWLLGLWWMTPAIALLAALHVYFIHRTPYDEAKVFVTYLSGLASVDVLLFV